MNFDFYVPVHILFGRGELNNLHKQPLPGKKALLVISNGKSARANGYLDRTIEQLKKGGADYVLFDKVDCFYDSICISNNSIAYNRNS